MIKDIKSMSAPEIEALLNELGQPSYRAKQIFSWLHKNKVSSYSEMTNIPKTLIALLEENYPLRGCAVKQKQISAKDSTVKYLFELYDGEFVESVVMKYKYGYTVCVSTQAGCKMGCSFCASTVGGFRRNLLPGEIVSEIYTAEKDLNITVSHIVLMGMGEPLDNYDNVMRFLELVTDVEGHNISMRNISLSTCGIVPRIYDLMQKRLGLTLSISLHAPFDEMRSRIMPVNNKYHIDELLKACRDYAGATSRRISFEYAMLSGINDTDECAVALAKELKGMLCHVNLIPVNEVRESPYHPSTPERVKSFTGILGKNGITATVRRKLGSDIDASCGQLRLRHTKGNG
ncbi:MAG: 23S rRNA (adenine(2503)-C(2))-methyltransferase RlmN [Clostridia bacterium]|nr:23S rRNA (adenine(2503)-C(2))-methyltransferase RlmN [Clostridia bacterium]